jgi:5-methylcytosine-specific restriction endonuclease McrA
MILIRRRSLPREAREGLARYQAEIDAIATYPAKVEHAKSRLEARNNSRNRVFRVVRETLRLMCPGPLRCMYCEDSRADEVEHFQPKDLYPELVLIWKNFLYACGTCNGIKSNQFAVIQTGTPHHLVVTRMHGGPVVAPPRGRAALINPRVEDPLQFFQLDLRDTFEFVPIDPIGTEGYERADYTLRVLGLNDRDDLISARQSSYEAFVSHLDRYIHRRDQGASHRVLARIPKAIRRSHHQTVWYEMKRQHARISQIRPLFAAAPEALDW